MQPDLQPLAPTLFRLRIDGGPAHLLNSYLVLDDDSVTLVDTGWADSAPVVEAVCADATLGASRVEPSARMLFDD